MIKYILWLLYLLAAMPAVAAGKYPESCQPMAIRGETVTFKTKQPAMVLIHNLGHGDLWLTHSAIGESVSTRIEAGNWSALAVDQKKFEFNCIESRPGHEQQIPCVGMVDACKWRGVKMPADSTGTFWAGENMELSALIAWLGGHGYRLPAASFKARANEE